MSQLSVSAVETGSAIVCSAKLGYCRRATLLSFFLRQCGKVALQSANWLSVYSYQLSVFGGEA